MAKIGRRQLINCNWVNKNPKGEGVIVSAIPEQSDMLFWFIENYTKHCSLPLVFADFGLLEKDRLYCKQYGEILDVSDISWENQYCGWMRKPFVCLRTPFQKTIWLDLDIEIKSDLKEFFQFCCNGNIGLAEDTYQNNSPGNSIFRENIPQDLKIPDTGVVVYEYGNKLIKEWAIKVANNTNQKYKGDNQVLGVVCYENKIFDYNIPKTLHQMRLDIDQSQPPKITYHWTGPAGKEHIKNIANLPDKNSFSFFEKIYCVHDEKNIERNLKIKKEFQNLEINYVFANRPHPEFKSTNFHYAGELGSTLSHLKLLCTAKTTAKNNILILEDDVELRRSINAKKILKTSIENLPNNWGALYLGGRPGRHGHDIEKINRVPSTLYQVKKFIGIFAYALNLKYIDPLILHYVDQIGQPFPDSTADMIINNFFIKNNIPQYAIYPFVISHLEGKSDIRQEYRKYDDDFFESKWKEHINAI